jgi:hypothetical protein
VRIVFFYNIIAPKTGVAGAGRVVIGGRESYTKPLIMNTTSMLKLVARPYLGYGNLLDCKSSSLFIRICFKEPYG